MSKFFTSIILFIASVGIFFGFIQPQYEKTKETRTEAVRYENAVNKSNELRGVRDELMTKKNGISVDNLARIQKMIPDTVDNIRLILDMDEIAGKYGLSIKNIKVSSAPRAEERAIGPDNSPYGEALISFSVSSSYSNFKNFLKDLEQSLRLVDITALSLKAGGGEKVGTGSDNYSFDISLKTYWLK